MTGYASKTSLSFLFLLLMVLPAQADEYVPSYAASPAAAVVTTPVVSCGIKVIRGDGAVAPEEVELGAEGMVGTAQVDQFVYDFGDGQTQSGDDQIAHRYGQAGTYTVTARPVIEGKLAQEACTTAVTLKTAPFINARKKECTGLTVLSTDPVSTADNVRFQVRGADSKGTLQGYRLQVAGEIYENETGDFSVGLEKAGEYVAEGLVKDADGNWMGGEGVCRKNILVKTAGLSSQPETGLTIIYWVILGGLAILWMGVELWHYWSSKFSA